jgi:predicted DNA-binding transcriptional regulator AlpA
MKSRPSSDNLKPYTGGQPSSGDLPKIDPLLNPDQAANYTGLTKPTLQRHRTEGTGPRFIKLGKRRVAYRLSDIRAWLEARAASSTADARERGLTG